MVITQPREHYRPYEYPELLAYRNAIRHSYWLHTEYSYHSDVQDHRLVDHATRQMVERALVAIAQVELQVKLFWARAYERLPKPEVGEVGMTFAESEVRHANAYAHLLDLLGLEEAFREALAGSALRAREDALKSVLQASRGDLASWTRALVLFSAFTEHVALFSAFYALLALNRRANLYKGTANAIEATSKEENIHGLFGLELVRILRREHPELFAERFSEDILQEAERFLRAEEDLVAWIFEAGDPSCVSQAETRAFLRDRMNRVLSLYGIPSGFAVDRASLRDVDWFDLELFATKEVDFFSKRSVAYSRRTRSFSPEELF